MYEGINQDDFLQALKSIGGCPHVPDNLPQNLDTICDHCRASITSLVLLRDKYERNPRWAEGAKGAE